MIQVLILKRDVAASCDGASANECKHPEMKLCED